MNELLSLTPAQLNRAADIKETIEKLESELAALLGSTSSAPVKRGPGRPKKVALIETDTTIVKRRKFSAAARAKMAATAKARWKKAKAAGKNSL